MNSPEDYSPIEKTKKTPAITRKGIARRMELRAGQALILPAIVVQEAVISLKKIRLREEISSDPKEERPVCKPENEMDAGTCNKFRLFVLNKLSGILSSARQQLNHVENYINQSLDLQLIFFCFFSHSSF